MTKLIYSIINIEKKKTKSDTMMKIVPFPMCTLVDAKITIFDSPGPYNNSILSGKGDHSETI